MRLNLDDALLYSKTFLDEILYQGILHHFDDILMTYRWQQVLGWILRVDLLPFCVEFARSPCGRAGSLQVPQSNLGKLPVVVSASVWMVVCLYVWPCDGQATCPSQGHTVQPASRPGCTPSSTGSSATTCWCWDDCIDTLKHRWQLWRVCHFNTHFVNTWVFLLSILSHFISSCQNRQK